jgi:hypothetical protein
VLVQVQVQVQMLVHQISFAAFSSVSLEHLDLWALV